MEPTQVQREHAEAVLRQIREWDRDGSFSAGLAAVRAGVEAAGRQARREADSRRPGTGEN